MSANRSSQFPVSVTPEKARSKIVAFQRESNPRPISYSQVTIIFLSQWLQALGSWLLGNSEPRIQEKRDSNRQLYFKVYDPCSQRSYVFDTENEVRTWLERRYIDILPALKRRGS